MKAIHIFVALLLMSVVFTSACGKGGGDDGVKPGVDKEMSDLSDIAKRVDGNYDKLTAAEKEKFKVYGNVGQVKKQLKLMAHPPNEQYLKKS